MQRRETEDKEMKKLWILCLAAILCLPMLFACNGKQPPSNGLPFSFLADGQTTVYPGMMASEVLEALSAKNPQISVKASCLGGVDGEDVTYVYQGFRIQTFRTASSEEIRWVILSDDSVKTMEGISIGDTVDTVKSAYGEPSETTDTLLTYVREQVKLRFVIRDGTVRSIEYTVAE
jgi:hypothetical protein